MKVFKLFYPIEKKNNIKFSEIFKPNFFQKFGHKCKIIHNNKITNFQSEIIIDDNDYNSKELKLKLILFDNIPGHGNIFNYFPQSMTFHAIKIYEPNFDKYKEYLNSSFTEISKMIYLNKPKSGRIKIFGENFVKNNKGRSLIMYKNNIFELNEYFSIEDIEDENKVEILLIELDDISNKSYMFQDCHLLEEFSSYIENKKESEIITIDEHSLYSNIRINISENNTDTENNSTVADLLIILNKNIKFNKSFSNSLSPLNDNKYTSSELDPKSSLSDIQKKDTIYLINISNLFEGCKSLISIKGISDWFTEYVVDMRALFNDCSSLKSLPDISNWNTKNVKDMSHMFEKCSSLESLPDISNWNTKNVIDMSCMFNECKSLISLPDISKWNTENIKEIQNQKLNYEEYKLINIPKKLKYSIKGFSSLLPFLESTKWKNNKITGLYWIFRNCLSLSFLPDISKWNTKNITTLEGMFEECKSLKSLPDISQWNTRNIKSISRIFKGCETLTSLPDISKWKTNNINDMSWTFYECSSLISLPYISKWNTRNVNNMEKMFVGCSSLKYLPEINRWDTNNLKNISWIFSFCSSLISLPDISKWNTENVINMSHIFEGCRCLLFPDISIWDTNNVRKMDNMFSNCSSLISLPDISKWNTKNVEDMSLMFNGCKSLISLPDISKWNIKNIKKMRKMFGRCSSLISLPDISKWNTDQKRIGDIFNECISLSYLPDLKNWKFSSVKFESNTFEGCLSLLNFPNLS